MKRGIDHLVLCVNDLEPGAAFYRQLGFTTTPRARHPWGTDNCLIQLNGSFIELLTVSRPSLISAAGPKTFSFGAFNQKFNDRVSELSAAAGRKRPVQSIKKLWFCAIVGSATVPTSFGGHGGPPYGPKHTTFKPLRAGINPAPTHEAHAKQ